jgi:hypothetical protein
VYIRLDLVVDLDFRLSSDSSTSRCRSRWFCISIISLWNRGRRNGRRVGNKIFIKFLKGNLFSMDIERVEVVAQAVKSHQMSPFFLSKAFVSESAMDRCKFFVIDDMILRGYSTSGEIDNLAYRSMMFGRTPNVDSKSRSFVPLWKLLAVL